MTTLFDDGDLNGWNRAISGELWAIATLTGVVNAVTNAAALERWEDGDGVEFHLDRGYIT
jgi:hypothetical protein